MKATSAEVLSNPQETASLRLLGTLEDLDHSCIPVDPAVVARAQYARTVLGVFGRDDSINAFGELTPLVPGQRITHFGEEVHARIPLTE
jgi:hypothetical protein